MTHPHEFQGIVTKLRTTKGSPYALDVMRDAADMIDAVLAIHVKRFLREDGQTTETCETCGSLAWPCATAAALGVEASSSVAPSPVGRVE